MKITVTVAIDDVAKPYDSSVTLTPDASGAVNPQFALCVIYGMLEHAKLSMKIVAADPKGSAPAPASEALVDAPRGPLQ